MGQVLAGRVTSHVQGRPVPNRRPQAPRRIDKPGRSPFNNMYSRTFIKLNIPMATNLLLKAHTLLIYYT